jgi:MFS family permease
VRDASVGLLRSDRDFRWYWAGQTLSVLGSQVTAVALPLVAALTLDVGPAGVSAVATASFLPNLLFSLAAGHWLEGRHKRRIMVWADIVRAALLAVVPVAGLTGRLSVSLLVVVAFAAGVASVFFEIGGFAYVPTLVAERDLGAANRAMQGSVTVAQAGGPGLAGALVQLLGPPLAVLVDAVSYIASAFGVAAAGRPEPAAAPDARRSAVWEGVRIIMVNPFLRALTIHASIYNAASQIFLVNLVIWLVQNRGVSPGMYGVALSGGGVGAFVGTMMALRLAARLGYGRAFAASLLLSTGVPLLVATLPWRATSLALTLTALQLIAGIGLGSANVLSITLRQTVIPHNQLARSNGGYRLLMYGSIPIGSALGGLLGDALGSRAGVAIGTIGLAISALPMFARTIRRLRDPHDARTERQPGRATT